MTKLVQQDIKTREVLGWQGVHLLHFSNSSCSQKTRIFLNLKGIDWVSHPVNLVAQKNYTPWFLGINPRGLVPVLVHDGEVYIESNDILIYLEQAFPQPELIPLDQSEETNQILKEEDDLHLDVRTLTMRFVFPKKLAQKNPESLSTYEKDSGTVVGQSDPQKPIELAFWQDFARQGITDEQVRISAGKFRRAYIELENRIAGQQYLMGDVISVVDIAWFIYTHRLLIAGYPFARLHPAIHRWYLGLLSKEEFSREVKTPPALRAISAALHLSQSLRGKSFERVAAL